MAETAPPLIDIAGLRKDHHAVEPLRIRRLTVAAGDRILLSGLDAGATELLVHLITGSVLPDEGDVRVGGHDTRDIATDTEWLTSLDRFGIVTDRAVLLEGLSIAANLALPMTVAIDPMSDEVRGRVSALAADVGLPAVRLDTAASTLTPDERVRVHVARALVSDPAILLLEHPTAGVRGQAESQAVGRMLRAVADARGLGWVAATEDDAFARAAGGRRLRLEPGTGRWVPDSLWRRLWRSG